MGGLKIQLQRKTIMADPVLTKPSLENGLPIDVIIIGGGPSGLSAAIELKRLGVSRVVVLEREKEAGGIPRHCGHPPFGMGEFKRILTGPKYAKKNVELAIAAKVEIHTMTTVVQARPDGELLISTNRGSQTISARRVIYATGVRESPRSARLISGSRLSGVINTGALQSMVYLKDRIPFKRPVIIGTELVSFSTIMTCRHAGIKPIAIIGESKEITARWPYAIFPNLLGIPFRTALRLFPRLMGVQLHLRAKLVAINGDETVSSVQIEKSDGTLLNLECDGVILTGKFTPESSLARCGHLEVDPATQGPMVDQFGRCSDPSFFATGNLLRAVETAGWCWSEGKQAGRLVAEDLNDKLPKPDHQIRVSFTDPIIKYAMPQIISLPHSPDDMKHLQLRFHKNAKGYLVGTQGGTTIFKQKLKTHPEHRVLIALNDLNNLNTNGELKLTFEEQL